VLPLRGVIEQLRLSDERLSERVQTLEVEVAKNYVQRGELTSRLDAISGKLDRIEASLGRRIDSLDHQKVDKNG